ncbi:unnamed protein product [Ranitomeya imitator]|uniref:Apoptosis-associated speck-like protein containing a CARD n=1 Tax=Ranitomeya imitator TaxID=111125 RepID=A0ABN9KSD9_9NEOB|nr:unnamed protein product [Ranitomeya imitator]
MRMKTVRDLLLQALENLENKSFKKFKNKLNDWDIEEEYARIPRGPLEVADPEDVADLIRRYYMDSYSVKVTVAVLEAINENREAEELEKAWKTVNCCTTKREDQGATSRGEQSKREDQGATSRVEQSKREDQGATSRGEQPEREDQGSTSRGEQSKREEQGATSRGEQSKREDQGATSRGDQSKREDQGATSRDQEHFVDRHRAQLIQRVHLLGQVLDDLLQNKLLTYEGYNTVLSMKPSQQQMRELYRYMSSWGNKDKDKFLQSLKTHYAPLIKTLE